MKNLQIGIIGGAGYTAGELIRLLLNHPETNINFVYSTSNAGNKLYKVHQDLIGDTEINFTSEINTDVDVLFLCLGHGNSTAFLEKTTFSDNTKIIDLSNDFRLLADKNFDGKDFVYGLPELDKEAIKTAKYIANPGCFATALQLAILPLAANGLLQNDIHINAVTGATGAGTSLSATTHFTYRDNNFSHYKAFNHQHLGEINQSVNSYNQILILKLILCQIEEIFQEEFLQLPTQSLMVLLKKLKKCIKSIIKMLLLRLFLMTDVHMKQVVNTNKCLLHLEKHGNKLLITSTIDNLLKGASGAAIQNMNLMYGFEETLGLNLKANYF